MISKREKVLSAVAALIAAACPAADVIRRQDKPVRLSPGGLINVLDGDPGEPETDLSPLRYNYDHEIPLEITLPENVSFDAFLIPIGQAIEADRFLGGLVDWLDVKSPAPEVDDLYGAEALQLVPLVIVASYATENPLT